MFAIEKLGSDILRNPNQNISSFDTELLNDIEQMTKTLRKAKGVGLAAPQVGINKNFFITEAPDDQIRVFVNPKIVSTSVETQAMEEGCLSVPGIWGEVVRPKKIIVEAFDEKGEAFKVKVNGYLARIIQHEYDHLQGILFVDYLDKKTQELAAKKIAKKKISLFSKKESK